jgi:hypothetical protein
MNLSDLFDTIGTNSDRENRRTVDLQELVTRDEFERLGFCLSYEQAVKGVPVVQGQLNEPVEMLVQNGQALVPISNQRVGYGSGRNR